MKRVISVRLPTWPTDRIRTISNAPLRDLPFATVIRNGSRRVLASVDANAAKRGLYPGQALAYAHALVPQLAIADADEAADSEGLRRIGIAFLKQYTPIVALAERHTLALDITGCAHLWGSEENLLNDLIHDLKARNIRVRAAIADTFGCAYALARCSKTTGTIVPPQQGKAWLACCPIAALRLPPGVAEGLTQLGFLRIEQLYTTPRGPLVRRFGKGLIQRLDQALGSDAEPLEPLSAPAMPQERCAFTEPASNPDFVLRAVEQLAVRLCAQLEASGLGARKLDLLFHRVDNTLQHIRIGTVSASRDPRHHLRLFKENFGAIDCGFGIEALTLRAPVAEPLQPHQCGSALSVPEAPDLSGLIDILRTRLGREHVYRTTPVESDVPERSVRHTEALASPKMSEQTCPFPRPARLLKHPEKIEALALLPDHAPLHFVWRRKRHSVKRADGPERIFGEWWKDQSETMAVRDYFQVEIEGGERFWLFRRGDGFDPRTGSHEWFLHGFFG